MFSALYILHLTPLEEINNFLWFYFEFAKPVFANQNTLECLKILCVTCSHNYFFQENGLLNLQSRPDNKI